MGSNLFHIEDLDELNELLEDKKWVIVDFWAGWCKPCMRIAPYFEELAKSNPRMTFVKVNVDEADEIVDNFGVNVMPTFIAFRDGEKVGEVLGANEEKLAELLEASLGYELSE